MKIEILPNYFLKENGTFDLKGAMNLSGKFAGVCYSKEGFEALDKEDASKTEKRVERTLNSGHHSVYDHVFVNLNIDNIPKLLAMYLNNEKQYTTSEKSARYTPVVKDDEIITDLEEKLYNKWKCIFNIKIHEKYGDVLPDNKINKLAGENARYLVTVFMPTKMIYTTSLRQLNILAAFMKDFINSVDPSRYFDVKVAHYMKEFLRELDKLNLLEPRLMTNDKNRKFSLFNENIIDEEYFKGSYSTIYTATFAMLAQAQRHRTISYECDFQKDTEYYVPPIIEDDPVLVAMWLEDMASVDDIYPQGELIKIHESGTFDNFILKCKERLCTDAQLEIMRQTRETLLKYQKSLEEEGHPLASDIKKYTLGARCTFPDFSCPKDCGFKEGKQLVRKI